MSAIRRVCNKLNTKYQYFVTIEILRGVRWYGIILWVAEEHGFLL